MPEPLKNIYNQQFFKVFTTAVKCEYKVFEAEKFIEKIFNEQWPSLELKQRMRHITHTLKETLPPDYRNALEILKSVTRKHRDFKTTAFTDMIFPDFVEVYGLDDPEASIPALELFTQYSSAEFAIRPFIIKYPAEIMAKMLEWSKHESHHVRRLSSEGSRPRLPWAMALNEFKKDPSPVLPILENLKADPSDYVRRSVANNLNDISKDHPQLVLKIASKWYGKNEHTNWIIRHASRGLLKKGNEEALAFFGFNHKAEINVQKLSVSKARLKIGEDFTFSFALFIQSFEPVKVRIEYGIYFVKANGTISRKVFKIAENFYKGQQEIVINKKHSFQELTTRKHYPGEHKLSIIINGKELAETDFYLESY